MELIDREKLREVLMHEQAKYIMSDHLQGKHTSAGFLLAIAELDSQPTVLEIEDGCEIVEVRCKRNEK